MAACARATGENYRDLKQLIDHVRLHTVCERRLLTSASAGTIARRLS